MARIRVLIAGAAGRDFHNFNLVYRDSPAHEVVAFTATQIPNIDGRRYPAELAGSLYTEGIPILPESALEELVREHEIDVVVFAYSDVTIEEREEYEPHLAEGNLVFAGIDYERILRAAEQEADVILWDGGNNDTPFIKPDLHIVVVDPHRPGHELRYHPGETNLRMADVCVVNKMDSATQEGIDAVLSSIHDNNANARIVLAASPFHVEGDAEEIRGKRVLAVEDGPTLTHGEMTYGAAVLAAKQYGAAELVDPRPAAIGTIAETFEQYPNVGTLLPAMGYGREQMEDLRRTIERSDADLVLIGTPIDLRKLIDLDKPALRVTYRLQEIGEPTLRDVLAEKGLLETALV